MPNGSEKAFSLGRFDIDYLDRQALALVRENGRVVAFANLLIGAGVAKFLVDRDGNVVRRFAPQDAPKSLASHIEKLL